MSDCIVDIDEELLGLFEDHDEVIYLSFLSMINCLTSKRLIKMTTGFMIELMHETSFKEDCMTIRFIKHMEWRSTLL